MVVIDSLNKIKPCEKGKNSVSSQLTWILSMPFSFLLEWSTALPTEDGT